MCRVNVNIDEATVRGINPHLDSPAAIRQWAQEVLDRHVAALVVKHRMDGLDAEADAIDEDEALAMAPAASAQKHPYDRDMTVEELYALDARGCNGLEVATYALAPYVAVDEMEPRFGKENAVGMQKRLFVGSAKRTMEQGRVGHGWTCRRILHPSPRFLGRYGRISCNSVCQEYKDDENLFHFWPIAHFRMTTFSLLPLLPSAPGQRT